MPTRHVGRLHASVIVNTYQQAAVLPLTLHALAEQDFVGRWEIVVVDDGSSDDTRDIVASAGDELSIPVHYVRLQDRGHRWTLARNIGARVATGSTLLFLDADMVPDRDVVRIHATEQQRESAVLAGNRLWRNPDTDLGGSNLVADQLRHLIAVPHSADPVCRQRELRETTFRHDLVAGPHPWRAAFGCHVSVPADTSATLDETMLGWGPADIEYASRLHYDHGLPIRYLHHARAWHLEHAGTFGNPFRTLDIGAATEYVRQICYMITTRPDHDLAAVLTMGFDRLVLQADGRWRPVPREEGGDIAQTLALALDWYTSTRPAGG
jgi:glycosyltransferase involved in cell wall biosynthesis